MWSRKTTGGTISTNGLCLGIAFFLAGALSTGCGKKEDSRQAKQSDQVTKESDDLTAKKAAKEPPVDESLTLDVVAADVDAHKGKRVKWCGKLMSMNRDSDLGKIRWAFVTNEGESAGFDDLLIFAADCKESDFSEDRLISIATSDPPLCMAGVVAGTAEVTITPEGGEPIKKKVPLLTSAVFVDND